jgi:hypothetical protein
MTGYLIIGGLLGSGLVLALFSGTVLNFNAGFNLKPFVKRAEDPFAYWWRVVVIGVMLGVDAVFGIAHVFR